MIKIQLEVCLFQLGTGSLLQQTISSTIAFGAICLKLNVVWLGWPELKKCVWCWHCFFHYKRVSKVYFHTALKMPNRKQTGESICNITDHHRSSLPCPSIRWAAHWSHARSPVLWNLQPVMRLIFGSLGSVAMMANVPGGGRVKGFLFALRTPLAESSLA